MNFRIFATAVLAVGAAVSFSSCHHRHSYDARHYGWHSSPAPHRVYHSPTNNRPHSHPRPPHHTHGRGIYFH